MELLGIAGLLVALAAAALRWGQDSRPEFTARSGPGEVVGRNEENER
jgi:hypothetical protein